MNIASAIHTRVGRDDVTDATFGTIDPVVLPSPHLHPLKLHTLS
jgi:hypothetical protein